jgi:hypothetical protein
MAGSSTRQLTSRAPSGVATFPITSRETPDQAARTSFRHLWVPEMRPGTLTCDFADASVDVSGLWKIARSTRIDLPSVALSRSRRAPKAAVSPRGEQIHGHGLRSGVLPWGPREGTGLDHRRFAKAVVHKTGVWRPSGVELTAELRPIRVDRAVPQPGCVTITTETKPQVNVAGRVFGTHRLISRTRRPRPLTTVLLRLSSAEHWQLWVRGNVLACGSVVRSDGSSVRTRSWLAARADGGM